MKYIYIPLFARNVIFSDSSEKCLKELQDRAIHPSVKKWISTNLKKYLTNEYQGKLHTQFLHNDPSWVKQALNRGDEIYDLDIIKDKGKFLHWIDYLNSLDNPSKVYKISVPQLIKAVEKWDKQLAKNINITQLEDEDGIKLLPKKYDGYTWVEVFGEKSLKKEGDAMGHCVGGAGYYRNVKNGHTKIYSLRDKNNTPHVTVEYNVSDASLEQVKGKQNKPPIDKYRQSVIDFINEFLIPEMEMCRAENEDLINLDLFFTFEEHNSDPENCYLIDFREDNYIDIFGKFEYTGNKIFSCTQLRADEIDIRYATLNINTLEGHYIGLYDCNVGIKSIQSEGETTISGGKITSDTLYYEGGQLVLESDPNDCLFSINTDDCYLNDSYIYRLDESNIEYLYLDAYVEGLDFGDDCYIGNIIVDGKDVSYNNPMPDITFGINNQFKFLNLSYNEKLVIPKGFRATELVISLNNVPKKIGPNVSIDKLVIDASGYDNYILEEGEVAKSVANQLKKFNFNTFELINADDGEGFDLLFEELHKK